MDQSSNEFFEEQTFSRGHIIVREGNRASCAYAIHSGRVKVYRTDTNNKPIASVILGKNDTYGLKEVLRDGSHFHTLEVIEPTIVIVHRREGLLKSFGLKDQDAIALAGWMESDNRVFQAKMAQLVNESVSVRVANLLVSLANNTDTVTDLPFPVAKLLRTEMAHLVGTTDETLSRVLRDFNDRGLIISNRTKITIIDMNKLKSISN